jgi:RNA polymerase sigma factor (sigma-70 family)
MRKMPAKARHPKLDEAWEKYQNLIRWWAAKLNKWYSRLTRTKVNDTGSIISYLFLKLNNALWLWDPKRGIKFSTYFSAHIHFQFRIHYLRFESDKESASFVNRFSRNKTSFKCRVYHETLLLRYWGEGRKESGFISAYLDIEHKDRKDYYNWVHDLIEELGGVEKAWKIFTMTINKRSADILHRRFVLGETLEQIGRHYKVTRERIRQLEFLAMMSLKDKFKNNKKLEALVKRYGLAIKD